MNNNKHNAIDNANTVYILKGIELNPKVTQRELASKLNMSLGKTNFLLNSLIKKGIIKAKNFKNHKNKLAYMYLFTPYGMNAKIKLTSEFLAFKMQEYERLKKEIELYKKEIFPDKRNGLL